MKIIKQLPLEKTQALKTHIQQMIALATPELAKCARGRLNFWLNAEPNYATGKYKAAHRDDRLWAFCQRIYPEAALAQIYFANDGHAIDWHRDASYAKPKAMIINLGEICLQTETEAKEIISLELTGGEIILFNSKLRHRAIHRSDDRIGIGLWADRIDIHDPNNWE